MVILHMNPTFHEDVLACTAKQDGAGFGVLALGDEGEVVVANLLNLKQPGAKTNVRLLDLVSAVDNGRSDSTKRSDVCVE